MRTSFISQRLALCLMASMPLMPAMAQTEAWPAKPIRTIVPFPAGGGTDIVARDVTQKMATATKWTFVIDNKPGSGGNLGIDAAAKAPADGYSLVVGQTSNLAINPSLYAKLPYDPVKDLTPIGLICNAPLVLVTAMDSPFKTLADVIKAAKAQPGHINYATSGNGTVAHLAGELAENAAGIQLRHIPYKGAVQAMTDLMGGQIDLYMSSVPTLLGQVRNGKLKVLAITGPKRSPLLPDVATTHEQGYDLEYPSWLGWFAPPKTPPALVNRMNAELVKVLRSPEVIAGLEKLGAVPVGNSPEEFRKKFLSELVKWKKVVEDNKIQSTE